MCLLRRGVIEEAREMWLQAIQTLKEVNAPDEIRHCEASMHETCDALGVPRLKTPD